VLPDTIDLCRGIAPEGLPGERLWGEWVKLLTLGVRPSRGLAFLHDCGWLVHFPELAALRGVAQDPAHHPEGDAWQHTLHCLDAFADERTGEPWEDLVVGCAVLCHDFGKPATTAVAADGRLRSLGHEQESAALTESFLGAMTDNRRLLAEVLPLVTEHMRPAQLYRAQSSGAAIRRLAVRVGRIDRLVRVARADAFGRPPLPATAFPAGDWLLAKAGELGVRQAPPPPLVQGRDLMALGAQPSPRFAAILAEIFDAQLAGEIRSQLDGLALAREILLREES
jgi:tRNA nucleotidyltransferase (CCA-adding enzyme)